MRRIANHNIYCILHSTHIHSNTSESSNIHLCTCIFSLELNLAYTLINARMTYEDNDCHRGSGKMEPPEQDPGRLLCNKQDQYINACINRSATTHMFQSGRK